MNVTMTKTWTKRLLLPLITAITLSACGGAGAPDFPPPQVEIRPVALDTWKLSYTASGAVEANNKVDLNSEVGGVINLIGVREGDRIGKGTLLVRLKADKYRDEYRERVMELVEAKASGKTRMDVVDDYAYPLPVSVICKVLGVPLEDVGALSLESREPEKCSGICAVLAETDVINMVSRGVGAEAADRTLAAFEDPTAFDRLGIDRASLRLD